MEDYIVAVKASEFGLLEGQDRKTKDRDDECFPIRVVRVRAIDDHHTLVKPVSAERKVRAEEESERGQDDPHSDPFPQCPVGQNESAAISTFHFTCPVCPGSPSVGRSSFVFYLHP